MAYSDLPLQPEKPLGHGVSSFWGILSGQSRRIFKTRKSVLPDLVRRWALEPAWHRTGLVSETTALNGRV